MEELTVVAAKETLGVRLILVNRRAKLIPIRRGYHSVPAPENLNEPNERTCSSRPLHERGMRRSLIPRRLACCRHSRNEWISTGDLSSFLQTSSQTVCRLGGDANGKSFQAGMGAGLVLISWQSYAEKKSEPIPRRSTQLAQSQLERRVQGDEQRG